MATGTTPRRISGAGTRGAGEDQGRTPHVGKGMASSWQMWTRRKQPARHLLPAGDLGAPLIGNVNLYSNPKQMRSGTKEEEEEKEVPAGTPWPQPQRHEQMELAEHPGEASNPLAAFFFTIIGSLKAKACGARPVACRFGVPGRAVWWG